MQRGIRDREVGDLVARRIAERHRERLAAAGQRDRLALRERTLAVADEHLDLRRVGPRDQQVDDAVVRRVRGEDLQGVRADEVGRARSELRVAVVLEHLDRLRFAAQDREVDVAVRVEVRVVHPDHDAAGRQQLGRREDRAVAEEDLDAAVKPADGKVDVAVAVQVGHRGVRVQVDPGGDLRARLELGVRADGDHRSGGVVMTGAGRRDGEREINGNLGSMHCGVEAG